jgi:ubiquinone/menaquinone biosynthesis C-methylase UbiE
MAQQHTWEREYAKQAFVSLNNKPHSEIVRLKKRLKKEYNFSLEGKRVIDLGCGTGRNSFYFASEGAIVTGVDIAKNAIQIAKDHAENASLEVDYKQGDISKKLPTQDETIDLAIDTLASNSLSSIERKKYVKELFRVLSPGGFFFIRALAKEGDVNAKSLLNKWKGEDEDSYVLPGVGLSETVFTRESLLSTYGENLNLLSLEKKQHYPKILDKIYKRQFYYALFQKPF